MLNNGNFNETEYGFIDRRDISQGENFLSALVNKKVISEAGKDFIIAATDPMHDRPLKSYAGFPDTESACSVRRCIKQTMTISKPASGITTDKWDLHITLWPWLDLRQFDSSGARDNNVIALTASTDIPLGGLTAVAVDANTDWVIGSGLGQTNNILSLDSEFNDGNGRVVGIGFEVHDVTAELYKQGAVTSWRQPECTLALPETWLMNSQVAFPAGGFTPFSAKKFSMPPANIAEAMLLSGSQQWESEQGTYVVAPMAGDRNPVQLPSYIVPVVLLEPDQNNAHNTTNIVFAKPTYSGTSAPNVFGQTKILPFHQTGAIFTGLNAQSTLQIQMNVYLETFPTSQQRNLVTMATPSAEYDPTALQLYSHVLTSLPVAVPASWNGLGEWFAEVVAEAADLFQPVASAINPLLGIATTAVGRTSAAYANRARQRKAVKKEVKKEVKKDLVNANKKR